MNDSSGTGFSVITTCRPADSIDKFFEQNPLVKQCLDHRIKISICNKRTEVPEQIASKNNVYLNSEYTADRPNLGELTKLYKRKHKLICNSDIFFEEDFVHKFKSIIKKTNKSFSGRRYDIPSSIYSHQDLPSRRLIGIGYLQSSRTLDYFMFNKFDDGIIEELAHLQPGTVGFDIYLASALNAQKRLCDVSKYVKAFHRNHEDFRCIYKTSLLINPSAAHDFVASRAVFKVSKSAASKNGDLSYCNISISQSGVLKNRPFSGLNAYVYQKLKTKLSNTIEKKIFKFNSAVYNIIKREISIFVVSRALKIAICLPFGRKTTDNFSVSVLNAIQKKIKYEIN